MKYSDIVRIDSIKISFIFKPSLLNRSLEYIAAWIETPSYIQQVPSLVHKSWFRLDQRYAHIQNYITVVRGHCPLTFPSNSVNILKSLYDTTRRTRKGTPGKENAPFYDGFIPFFRHFNRPVYRPRSFVLYKHNENEKK